MYQKSPARTIPLHAPHGTGRYAIQELLLEVSIAQQEQCSCNVDRMVLDGGLPDTVSHRHLQRLLLEVPHDRPEGPAGGLRVGVGGCL